MNHSCLRSILTLLLALNFVPSTEAGCCDRCGTDCATQLVCRTICTTEIREVDFFDERCETIGLPPKSLSVAGCLDEMPCDACGDVVACDACDHPTPLLSSWTQWFGHRSRCHFRDRKKLMRKSYIEYVPRLECVVEELCAGCCGVSPHALPGEELEPLPAPVVPPEASAPPVRLQISDGAREGTADLPPVIPAPSFLEENPEVEQALAPIAPVVHSLHR